MSEKTKTYEGMFLLDAGDPDFHAVSEPVRAILERREAKVLALNPWDERRLAYIIQGRKRGLYVLAYFEVDPQQVVEIEHDCRLDERILRAMIIRRDKLSEETINAETPAMVSARRAAERPAPKPDAETETETPAAPDKADPAPQPETQPAPDPAPSEETRTEAETETETESETQPS